jgi:hypothetical protein
MPITELEHRVLEGIAKREDIRFARVSRTFVEQGDAIGAIVEEVSPVSAWEVGLVLRAPDSDDYDLIL